MYNYHFYIATIMFFFEWWLPETPLILQYLNGICNIPSSLPFVNLDTHSELSTTLVVLAKFSATHASSSNFVPTIRMAIYTQLKPEQYVKPTHGNVFLPISLVTEGVLGDPHVVLISICLISVHGHHLSVIMTFIEGFELTLTRSALRMVLTYAAGAAATN